MRYLTPDILVERRLGENPCAWLGCCSDLFRSTVYSQELVRGSAPLQSATESFLVFGTSGGSRVRLWTQHTGRPLN